MARLLGAQYAVKSYGVGDGKEGKIAGRYMNKTVDIAVYKNGRELGGIAVKFIMTNYSQNSNNYFESMLGETANIRSGRKAYFQIIVLPESLPYFGGNTRTAVKDGITKIETVSAHNIEKYVKLSNDNPGDFPHAPNKNLFYLIRTPDISRLIGKSRDEWRRYLSAQNPFTITECDARFQFGEGIIYNDYADFINKTAHYFMSM